MINGYFKLHRKLLNSDLWLSTKPFTPGQAWIDLVGLANYFDGVIELSNGDDFLVKRGQVPRTRKFLADRWGWHVSKVNRFFKQLTRDQRIKKTELGSGLGSGLEIEPEIEPGSGLGFEPGGEPAKMFANNLVSIINYDKYNVYELETELEIEPGSELEIEPGSGLEAELETEPKRIRSNNKKNINKKRVFSKKIPDPLKKTKKTLITDAIRPDKKTKNNTIDRAVFWLYDILFPLHGNKHFFKHAIFEKWHSDIRIILEVHKRDPVEFQELVKWAIDYDDGVAFIQSSDYFRRKSGSNYDILLGKKEAYDKRNKEKKPIFNSQTLKK